MGFRLPANIATFDEVDEFNATDIGWDLQFRQLGRGRLAACMSHVITPAFGVVHLSLGSAVHQVASDPPGTVSFSFLDPECPPLQWCGQEVGPDHVLCSDAESGFESFTPPGFKAFALTVGKESLEQVAQRMGAGDCLSAISATTALGSIERERVAKFRAFLARHIAATENARGYRKDMQSLVAARDKAVYEELVWLLTAEHDSKTRSPQTHRSRQLKGAISFISENARYAISIADVSQELGISARTLQRLFQDRLQTTPQAVIKKARLDGVRRELRSEKAPSTVREVAGRWGFWHMGDFGRDYSREFGELPVESRRQRGRY